MARQNRTNSPFSTGTTPTGAFGTTAPGVTSTPGGVNAPTSSIVRRPSPEAIRKRAYELYCARKGQGGTPEDDWFRAERELIARG